MQNIINAMYSRLASYTLSKKTLYYQPSIYFVNKSYFDDKHFVHTAIHDINKQVMALQ